MKVKVITYHIIEQRSDESIKSSVESTKVIDHDNSSDRKWLGSHCFWAMRNNRMVTTFPL